MKKRLLLAAVSIVAILGSHAQINSPTAVGYLHRAVAMMADGNYFGAIDQLDAINADELTSDQQEKMQFYRATATVHIDKSQAINLLQQFLADYPESLQRAEALLALGDCYYGSNYNQALKIYNTISEHALPEESADALNYRKAYCYLNKDNLEKALPLFEGLVTSKGYGNASMFYCGYIAYSRREYRQAEMYFKEVNTSSPPGNMATYYLAQIMYMRDDYKNTLSLARNLLRKKKVGKEYMAEANRLAGEASYMLGDDAQAIKYLNVYVSMVQKPLPSSEYILGLNAYNKGNYTDAVKYLSHATDGDDAMSQSAYLYLGQAYMHLGEFTPAAMAFNRALNMQHDLAVRETAYYNYAIASLNGGKVPMASTVKIFSDFLRLYPDSQYADDVQDYIVTSYITDNNYQAALESIDSMVSPSDATLAAKQRVLYVLGVKALANSDAKTAIKYLDEASSLSKYNKDINREVCLAKGEAYYQLGDYTKAVNELKAYIKAAPKNAENLPLAHYDLGYALFAQKDYAEAAKEIEMAVASSEAFKPATLADAYNRLGDCFYYAKDFENAANAYDSAYNANAIAGDYPLFQKALMAGYMRDYNKKIFILQQLQKAFPASSLLPDALLETTESYIQLGQPEKAIVVYSDIVKKYPNTVQGRQAYLQMALVKLNTGMHGKAVADYKNLIKKYPTSDEAQQAVEQMKRIAAADGTLPEFMAYLDGIANAPKIDASEAEQLTYEEAEHEYLENRSTGRLVAFVKQYPKSQLSPRALAYVVDEMYDKGDIDSAYEYATMLVDRYPDCQQVQDALIVKAQIEETQDKGNLALRTWQQLEDAASIPANLIKARAGVMRNSLKASRYDVARDAANALISTAGIGNDLLAEAYYTLGVAQRENGNTKAAREAWEAQAEHTDQLYGIMCAFSLGESLFQSKDLKGAEQWAKKVSNADSPHTYWIARGFILLSDVYSAQGDSYKARQYLEAVRDNYTGSEKDIFDMISKRLK